MVPRKMIAMRVRGEASCSISAQGRQKIHGPANKMFERFEQFRLEPERDVDYMKIHENLSFRYFMQYVDLENY